MKSEFLTPLVCEIRSGKGYHRILREPLRYRSALLTGKTESPAEIDHPVIIEVPAGFDTDFASVPRGLWNLVPPDGPYTPAAVIHDWLYRHSHLDRKTCDAVFLEAMKVCQTPLWQRTLIWSAVRAFGKFARHIED